MEITALEAVCAGLEPDGTFSVTHTGWGEDRSPGFLIKNLSPQAQSLAVTLEDMSHPIPAFTHWVIWNLPAGDTIPDGILPGKQSEAVQGTAYGRHRYAGPKPPRGKTHTYRFTIYALDSKLKLRRTAGKKAFLRAAEGHILQKGMIFGKFF